MILTLPLLQTTLELNIGEAAQTAELSGSTSTFGSFVSSLLQASMVIAAIILLVFLVWAGIDWLTAGGDSGKIEKARQKITQSIIGIIVLASTVALFSLVQRFLGIDVFNFRDAPTPGSRATNRSVLDQLRDTREEQAREDSLRDRLGEQSRENDLRDGLDELRN